MPADSWTTRVMTFMIVRLLLAGVDLATAGGRGATWPGDPATVVVEVTEALGGMAELDRGPWLRVYGDGRVVVHRPAYMRAAGEWTGRLEPEAMQRLIDSLVARGLLDFDPAAARRAIAASRTRMVEEQHTLVAVSDVSTTTISLRANGRSRRIAWRGLRADARVHPGVVAVQALRAAQAELLALMAAPGLERAR